VNRSWIASLSTALVGFLVVFVPLLAAAQPPATGGAPPRDEPRETTFARLADAFLAHVSAEEYQAAADLMHYPASFTPDERRADAAAVAASLRILGEELGQPADAAPFTGERLSLNVAAYGGSNEYWAEHPDGVSVDYAANFTEAGPGWVLFLFVDVSGEWEIGQIAYGLPSSRPDARPRLTKVLARLQAKAQEIAAGSTPQP
jgi:hypothetical protein